MQTQKEMKFYLRTARDSFALMKLNFPNQWTTTDREISSLGPKLDSSRS
jgi:hypothetical protein